jgi:threonine dehydrogenase-like Zn-dependent dehydrogenase
MTEYDKPLEVRELPMPNADPGGLIVKVEMSSVCGSDVHTWRGAINPLLSVKPPLVLGHEIVGSVVEIGDGAETDSVGNTLRVGDRVVWEHASCQRCEACTILREPTLCPNRRIGMFHNAEEYPYVAGGFAEYSYVWPGAGRIRVPDELPSEYATVGSCAVRTVVNAFERIGPINTSSRVLVQGAGPLGLFAIAYASRFNPRQIIAVGAPEGRLEIARQWGATDTVSIEEHPEAADRVSLLTEMTSGGPDVLFEMSGAHGAFAEGINAARRAARYMVVGTVGGAPQEVDVARIVARQLRVTGTLSSDIGAYHKALEFLVGGMAETDWSLMFTDRRYGLGEATEALDSLATMREVKPLIVP